MRKIFRHSILVAAAFVLFLGSCLSESILPYASIEEEGYKTISLYVTQSEADTRGISRPVCNNELVDFRTGDLYFVNAARAVVKHFRITPDDAAVNNIALTVGIGHLQSGTATFENVPGSAIHVYIIGNTLNNETQGNIDAIINREINITAQRTAVAPVAEAQRTGVNLFGSAALSNTNSATVALLPTVARLEIGGIEGTGSIAGFRIEGLFIDTFYSQARINGAVIPASLWTGGSNTDEFRGGHNHFTDGAHHPLFDLPPDANINTWRGRRAGLHDAVGTSLVVTPGNPPGTPGTFPCTSDICLESSHLAIPVWAYQVFAQANTLPRVVIRLSNIQLIDNSTPLSGYRYVTVSVRQFHERATNNSVVSIDAGRVYHIPMIRFDENDLALTPNRITSSLSIDQQVIILPHTGGSRTLTLTTGVRNWEVNRGDSQEWANLTGLVSLGTPQVTGNTFTVAVTQPNNTDTQRTTTLTVTAPGANPLTIYVIQLGYVSMAAMPNAFVGAFWRNNQRGERLIRMPNPNGGGAWSAITTEDWIVLDRDLPSAVANHEAGINPETRLLPGNAQHNIEVDDNEATDIIYFRIGLTSTIPPNAMPRYGQVIVTHSGKTHIIWIRQGEQADYLMRPTDPMTITGNGVHIINEPRSAAAKISPFNITHPNAQTQNAALNTTMPARSGRKVDYPSQAGALFQFGGTGNQLYAWSPVGVNRPGNWATGGISIGTFWSSIWQNYEACPPGYRRPRDGSTTSLHPNTSTYELRDAELRQSLIYNVSAGEQGLFTGLVRSIDNAVPGFLADGFFDRRPITSAGSTPDIPDRVEANNHQRVAFRGALFFNPYSGASIFIPFAGMRSTTGAISPLVNPALGPARQGVAGFIHTATMRNQTSIQSTVFDLQVTALNYTIERAGMTSRVIGGGPTETGGINPGGQTARSLRCVRDPHPRYQ